MELKRTLEKIISPVRLGWHGVLIAGTATTVAYFLDSPVAKMTVGYAGLGGLILYLDSLGSFLRTRKNIKKYGKLDKRFVEPHLIWYCNRQGTRTAAANYGLTNEFDKIMNNYNEPMELTFIPHI